MSKQKKGKKAQPLVKPAGGMAAAADWPVFETLLSHGWQEQGKLVSVLIARRSLMSGKVACASCLVDLACLGVKSAQVKIFKDAREYAKGLRAHVMAIQPMGPADFNLAVKIILTGLEYAAKLGFKPDPVFAQAEPLLRGANLAAVSTPVPTGGPEGKPLFINGPYDDPQRIIAHLTRTVGVGNFHYIIGSPDTDMLLMSDDSDDEEEEDDEAWLDIRPR